MEYGEYRSSTFQEQTPSTDGFAFSFLVQSLHCLKDQGWSARILLFRHF